MVSLSSLIRNTVIKGFIIGLCCGVLLWFFIFRGYSTLDNSKDDSAYSVESGFDSDNWYSVFNIDDEILIDSVISNSIQLLLPIINTQEKTSYILALNIDGSVSWKSDRVSDLLLSGLALFSDKIYANSSGGVTIFSNNGALLEKQLCGGVGTLDRKPTIFGGFLYALSSFNSAFDICDLSGNITKTISSDISGIDLYTVNVRSLENLRAPLLNKSNAIDLEKVSASGWLYKDVIAIENLNNANDLRDYQVPIVLNTQILINQDKIRSDCADMRFYDSSLQTELFYWLESGCNTETTKIWVKVPYIKAKSITYLYFLHGNSAVGSASSSQSTFDYVINGLVSAHNFDEKTGATSYDSSLGTTASLNGTNIINAKFYKGREFIPRDDLTWNEHLYSGFVGKNYYSNFTYEAWVYPKKATGTGGGTVGQSYIVFPSGGNGVSGGCSPGSDGVGAGVSVGTNGISIINHAPCYVPAVLNFLTPINDWVHVVVVYADDVPSIYLNGVFRARGSKSGYPVFASNIVGDASITTGSFSDYGPLHGELDNFKFYGRSLTDTEIINLSSGFGYTTPSEPSKVFMRKFSPIEPTTTVLGGIGKIVITENFGVVNKFNVGTQLFDIKSGDVKWTHSASRGYFAPIVSDDSNTIFTVSQNGYLYALSAFTGEELWSYNLQNERAFVSLVENNILIVDSFDVIGVNKQYVIRGIDQVSGANIWQLNTSGQAKPVYTVGDNKVYLYSRMTNEVVVTNSLGIKIKSFELPQGLTPDNGIDLSIRYINSGAKGDVVALVEEHRVIYLFLDKNK